MEERPRREERGGDSAGEEVEDERVGVRLEIGGDEIVENEGDGVVGVVEALEG